MMNLSEPVFLTRDCEAVIIPAGTKVTLQKGEVAYITQSLGGSHTVVVNGNMFRIDGKDADVLGLEPMATPLERPAASLTKEELEKQVWDQMKTCYDPEIPINIVDLGLVYECKIESPPEGGYRVDIKITLTAPGCGMGDFLKADVQKKVAALPGVAQANVEVVFEPQWNQSMMSEAAKLQLGMM